MQLGSTRLSLGNLEKCGGTAANPKVNRSLEFQLANSIFVLVPFPQTYEEVGRSTTTNVADRFLNITCMHIDRRVLAATDWEGKK